MYQNFPGNFISAVTGHDCCDFCASSCICDDSDCVIKTKLTVGANSESNTTVYQPVRNVNREQRESLSVKMETYRKTLVSEKYLWTYCINHHSPRTYSFPHGTRNTVGLSWMLWMRVLLMLQLVNWIFFMVSLLSKLIETCSVLPLISCSSNIKPALTLTHHRANPNEVKDLT